MKKNMKTQTINRIAVLSLGLLVSACSTMGDRASATDKRAEAAIAENLVLTIAQVPSLSPLLNTVQMSPPITTFGERVASLLADSGYGIQTVDGDTGEFFVRYREEEISSELGVETSYVVAIGNVSVARSFDLSGGEDPRPVSPLFVAGAPEFDISLNDDVFAQVDADVSYALFDESTSPTVIDFDTQTAQVISDQSEGVTVTGVSTNNATPIQVAAPQVRVKENVFHLLESNFAGIFEDYDNVKSEILVFGNDSMRLGEGNKRIVQQYVEAFNPETDLVSIIGCSHGNTAVRNGNAVLAVGRANRVKEAFLFAGLDDTKVLEEGCWAGEYHDSMPRRGVLLTLKRRAG
jgi:hypothetical protein